MGLRVIVQTVSAEAAANVGGPVWTEIRTFDIEADSLEAFLREKIPALCNRQVIGVELLKPEKVK